METPPEIIAQVKTYLGIKALAIQRKEGRGAWVVTSDNQARYVPAVLLPQVMEGDDVAQTLQMVANFDPSREVVVIFNTSDDLQMVTVVSVLD